jgi:hypothetical protein
VLARTPCHISFAPKEQPFAKPWATPRGHGKVTMKSRPNGPKVRLGERLARWAVLNYVAPCEPGRCPGLDEPRAFGPKDYPLKRPFLGGLYRPCAIRTTSQSPRERRIGIVVGDCKGTKRLCRAGAQYLEDSNIPPPIDSSREHPRVLPSRLASMPLQPTRHRTPRSIFVRYRIVLRACSRRY